MRAVNVALMVASLFVLQIVVRLYAAIWFAAPGETVVIGWLPFVGGS